MISDLAREKNIFFEVFYFLISFLTKTGYNKHDNQSRTQRAPAIKYRSGGIQT